MLALCGERMLVCVHSFVHSGLAGIPTLSIVGMCVYGRVCAQWVRFSFNN